MECLRGICVRSNHERNWPGLSDRASVNKSSDSGGEAGVIYDKRMGLGMPIVLSARPQHDPTARHVLCATASEAVTQLTVTWADSATPCNTAPCIGCVVEVQLVMFVRVLLQHNLFLHQDEQRMSAMYLGWSPMVQTQILHCAMVD